jgi:hypothetical protein
MISGFIDEQYEKMNQEATNEKKIVKKRSTLPFAV